MRLRQLEELRRRAMAAAQMYGCQADVQVVDEAPANTSIGVKVVVACRSAAGELLTRERDVTVARRRDAVPPVMQMVHEAVVLLAGR